MANIQTFLQNILSARYGKDVRQSIHDAIVEIDGVADTAQTSATAQAEAARKSALSASENASAATVSENNAKTYMQYANASATNAKASEEASKLSETNSKSSETNAKLSEEKAQAVFESLPEDYGTLSKEFYEVAIKQKASGEDIHVTDSANAKVREFALYGKAKQNTTTGKNLLENVAVNMQKNGITFVINEDKSITVTGTANQTSDFYVNGGYAYTENILPISSGKIISSGTKTNLIQLFLLRNEDVIAKAESGEDISISLTGELTAVMYRVPSGVTLNNVTIYPMIRKCDKNGNPIGDDTYEQFTNGASPNPQYPQPIEVSGASGSVEVKSCGKNLLKNTATSIVKNGLTITVNNDKSITVNGTAERNVFVDLMMYKIHIDKGVLSGCPSGGSSNTYRLYANVIDDNDNLVKAYYDYGNGTEVDIKSRVVQVRILIVSGKSVENLTFYPMLSVEGGEYEPYKETLSTIPTENGLSGIKVSSGGNYTDSNGQQWICDEVVKYADGSGEYIQRIRKYVLNGSEAYSQSSYTDENRLCIYTRDTAIADGIKSVVCDRFIDGDYTIEKTLNIVNSNAANINFGVSKTIASTIEEFKTWLSSNPTTVYVELATPIVTPLTAEEIAEIEKLHTFYPVTNISNDFDCGMSVTYYCDSKNYIDKKISELATAMVNNI